MAKSKETTKPTPKKAVLKPKTAVKKKTKAKQPNKVVKSDRLKFHYYLRNSAGWAGISIEIGDFKKDYPVAYGWLDCDIKDLLGGLIALIGNDEKFCMELKEKYLNDDEDIFEWKIISEPEEITFQFILLNDNKIEMNIFESDVFDDEDETTLKVFTEQIDIYELIDCVLYSCTNVINKYGILGYHKNFWIEFPLFYYLYLKNIIERKIEYEEFFEEINNEKEKMIKTNINDELSFLVSYQGIK